LGFLVFYVARWLLFSWTFRVDGFCMENAVVVNYSIKMRKLIFVLMLMMNHESAFAKEYCEHYRLPKSYIEMQSVFEKKLHSFSQKKDIALTSDTTLSKLIKANSSVIKNWMDKRNFQNETEDQIAREWRVYCAKNFILTKYPSGDLKIDKEIESFVDSLLGKYLDQKFRFKLDKLFQEAKKTALKTIERFDIPEKKEISKRINSIKLYIPEKLKTARNNAVPLDLVDWGIAYDPLQNSINVGLKALIYLNDLTLIAVFAHEIGHSFDSCRWGAFFTGKWPFEKVGECLRSQESVGAKKRDDRLLEQLMAEKKIAPDLAKALKENPTCNKSVYPPLGMQADQLPESFADWFSTEVVANASKTDVSFLRLDLCEKQNLVEGSSYPSNRDRLEMIYKAHPGMLGKAVGLQKKAVVYCPYKKE